MTGNSSRKPSQSTVIGMHIVDLSSLVEQAVSLDELLLWTEGIWSQIHVEMDETETLWVFAPNRYHDQGYWPVSMAVADFARDETGLILKNIITRFQQPVDAGDLQNTYEDILFFVKDKRAYQFNKNAIRVDHVYKGNEWGDDRETGRSSYHDSEVQRYHPDGKDPGNVWLSEIRDKSPSETIDETQPLNRTEAIKRIIRAGSAEMEVIHLWLKSKNFEGTVRDEGRKTRIRSINNGETV